MKQYNSKTRGVIHGLSMAVFLGACLGLQADDKGISAKAEVNTDRDNPRVEVKTDRNERNYRVDANVDRNDGKLSRGDASFIRDAAKGGMMEVQMGQSAKDHASNAEVKAFGERLVKDHSEANKKLNTLAAQKGVNLAKDIDHGDAHKGAKMSMDFEGKKGAEFDKAFVKHAIKDHKKGIEKFERASRDSEDSDVKAFASATLPKLREHQMEAERLAKVLGVDVNVTDTSEINGRVNTEASGAPARIETDVDVKRDRDARIEGDVKIDRDRDAKIDVDVDRNEPRAESKIEVDTDKGDGKTLGVTTEANDGQTLGVETQKGDGKVLGVQTGPGDGKTLGLNTSKSDGKLLGIFPAPGRDKAENRVDVDIDRDDHKVEVDANANVGGPGSSEKGASARVDVDADKDAKVMIYSEVPAKVQATIKAEGGNNDVKVRKHTLNGKTVYKVNIEKDGRNRVLQVAEDGTIIKDNNAK